MSTEKATATMKPIIMIAINTNIAPCRLRGVIGQAAIASGVFVTVWLDHSFTITTRAVKIRFVTN